MPTVKRRFRQRPPEMLAMVPRRQSRPSNSRLDEDAQAFDGATSVTNLGQRTEGLSHKCDLYGYTNPFALSFGYIHKDTKAFRVMTDEGLNRAMM